MDGGIELNARIEGHSRIDFDKRRIRNALRGQGRVVQKTARRLVARRAISGPGENPGRVSGELQRGIKVRVGGGGYWVKIAPMKTPGMGPDFYPAYLYYGTPSIKKRGNYMVEALDTNRAGARRALMTALNDSLIPRK